MTPSKSGYIDLESVPLRAFLCLAFRQLRAFGPYRVH
jgi:hypothetical protein